VKEWEHGRPLVPASPYRPLGDGEVERIAEAALTVLAESGMAVYSDEALDALVSAGGQVDGDSRTVKLPRPMVEDAIASNPSSVTLFSRDGTCDAVLEQDRVHYGTGGTAIYVLDPETGQRRASTVWDVAMNARLVDVLENIHVFTINVFPNDVGDKDEIDANRFFHALDNTTKHVMGGIYSMAGLQKAIRIAELAAGGAEALRSRPIVSFITLVISPFKIDGTYGDMTCHVAREGLPVVVPTEPMCGTTSPVTLAGSILTHTAETLAGIALVQAVCKGAPGICGSVGSISDLRTMGNLAGAIERAMINAAVAQMAQHFGLPLYSTGGTTDAKEVNVQAAYESAMSSLLVAMSGANYIHDIAGLMEFDLTVSYEKLVVDNEILGMCQRVLRGIEVDDETLALDLILEQGPGGCFMAETHTVDHMRGEFFTPRLANRAKREGLEPGEDAMGRARDFVRRVVDGPHESKLAGDVRARILEEFPEVRPAEAAAPRAAAGT
jgi:trimethylamine--corrinoid protein Co-methyltransferase